MSLVPGLPGPQSCHRSIRVAVCCSSGFRDLRQGPHRRPAGSLSRLYAGARCPINRLVGPVSYSTRVISVERWLLAVREALLASCPRRLALDGECRGKAVSPDHC